MSYRFLRFPEGKFKAVTFSYDDGVQQDVRLARLFDRYGLKGTFNLNSARVAEHEGEVNLTESQIRTHLLEAGHEIAVHGEWHIAPGVVRPVDGIQDVLNGRLGLEQRFGRLIRGMAYPDTGVTRFANGTNYETIRHYLRDLGIVYARSLAGDNNRFEMPADWLCWIPTAHHDNPDLSSFLDEFIQLKPPAYLPCGEPRLFYLWGHSYEFDRNNNWDHMETVCEKLAGRDDTWYATNGEIYDYAEAYNRLVISVDGQLVFNPSLIPVWFCQDGTLYRVNPGETLNIAGA